MSHTRSVLTYLVPGRPRTAEMRERRNSSLARFVSLAFVISLPACAQILGTDGYSKSRVVDAGVPASTNSDGGANGAAARPSGLCTKYCNDIQEACRGDAAVYVDQAVCLGVCASLPPGNTSASGNTIACRERVLHEPSQDGSLPCDRAGPSGGPAPDGELACGSPCESYCELLKGACPDEYGELSDCMASCAALRDAGPLSVSVNHAGALQNGDPLSTSTDYEGDTLQCRLVHASVATVNPEPHCVHARILPTLPCADPPTMTPLCADYCRVVLAACGTRTDSMYRTDAQCEAACALLPKGTVGDTTGNSIGCRLYHAYNALLNPEPHCAHAGPSGGGVCGDACEPYCTILASTCKNEFASVYAGDPDTCLVSCRQLSSEELTCRLLAATASFPDKDPVECSYAVGETVCDANAI